MPPSSTPWYPWGEMESIGRGAEQGRGHRGSPEVRVSKEKLPPARTHDVAAVPHPQRERQRGARPPWQDSGLCPHAAPLARLEQSLPQKGGSFLVPPGPGCFLPLEM